MSMSRSGHPARHEGLALTGLFAVLAALVLVISGCTIPTPTGSANETTPATETSEAAAPAELTVTPKDGATGVAIRDGVTASVTDGTITKAVLTNDAGQEIDGTITKDGSEWAPDIPLGYGRTYTLAVTYEGETGKPKTDKRSFSMANPQSIVNARLNTTGGVALESNREYGVGIVVAAQFDRAVLNKEEAEKYMKVTTTPEVEGNWYWLSDSVAHWRPREYYATGTRVQVDLDLEGRDLGDGQWGGEDSSVDFTIGERRVAIADDATKMVTVYHDQKPVKTMPTSMGKGGWATYNGIEMHFWTQPGTYTVLDKAPSVLMDSSTYGLPLSAGYKVTVADGVRLNNEGIYFHALESSMWAQGNTNTSHGCLNLSPADAQWYFDQAVTGDVVEVRGTGGPELTAWQNGDWSVPWEEWQTGAQD